ncbi:hypothetical protein DRN52_08455 [Thermococci archaeon]|nr:MAG: hypothetical protein DRN52_08455 [Thermococci archaeon]
MVVKVAWVSRHRPTPAQVDVLRKKLGEIKIFQLSQTFRDANEVLEEIKKRKCEYAVLVLPLSMIARLVKDKTITWLWAEMEALHICDILKCEEWNPDTDTWLPLRGEKEGRHMRFKGFKKIKKVELVLEEW